MLNGVNLAALNAAEPKHVLAVIPARLGATRLPRKPLRDLAGKPLVVRVYERIQALAVATDIVVATDHAEVIDACNNHNVPACLTDTGHLSGTDRIAEVVSLRSYQHYDVILNVQGDEPFISRDAALGALSFVIDGVADVGTAAFRIQAEKVVDPDVVKVVTDSQGKAMYFSRAQIPYCRDASDVEAWHESLRQHIGVYAYSRDALLRWVSLPPHPLEVIEKLEQLRALANGISIGVYSSPAAPEKGIDTEEDLRRANALFAQLFPSVTSTFTSNATDQ